MLNAMSPTKLLFLPGASGNTRFWQPVADLLAHPAERVHLGWPGFGPTPPDPDVHGIDDLVARVVAEVDQPVALIAQSMGGLVALRVALERPDLVTHLVLSVTSGGIDLAGLGAQDWRPAFAAANPSLPGWFAVVQPDLSARLHVITAPVLLLWGDSDPISPVAVGEKLQQLLPQACLHVLAGGTHDVANVLAHRAAPLIDAHLAQTPDRSPGR
jgi:pimeloyl-ACP methyl ester carboxylesterase